MLDRLCFALMDIAAWLDNRNDPFAGEPTWYEWVPIPYCEGGFLRKPHYGWRVGRYV